jgi:CDP-paratose 2-epimerase
MNILITGGAGFIGSNAAKRFIEKGHRVAVIDDLSRGGSERNIEWLQSYGAVQLYRVDVSKGAALLTVLKHEAPFHVVLHLAGQVGVTQSIADPMRDFEVNALGTLNLLEGLREIDQNALLIHSSTNKVYGAMDDLPIIETGTRYEFAQEVAAINERRPLRFQSPYGCSKGAAEQYVRDYHETFGMRTVVLRQSCICGPRQFGCEEQGWVTWLTLARLSNLPIRIFGDGKQVRDVLWIDDLVDLFEKIIANASCAIGKIYNVGGGSNNSLSVLELLKWLDSKCPPRADYIQSQWRTGDQRIYISDITRVSNDLLWRPSRSSTDTLSGIVDWVSENISVLRQFAAT